jgi:hypothetical protein
MFNFTTPLKVKTSTVFLFLEELIDLHPVTVLSSSLVEGCPLGSF